ncbi:MAG: serine hydrolase [Vicinamibacterales bacterium]|nr:serine hydrolase [Vicinamibacterales bacterium]
MILLKSHFASPSTAVDDMTNPKRLALRAARLSLTCLIGVMLGTGIEAAQASKGQSGSASAGGTASAQKAAPTKTSAKYSSNSAAARRARLARAQAAARARDLAAAKVPRFKLDDHGDLVPDVRAEAAIVYNPTTGEILWETEGFSLRSIASITKVMTALCFLEDDPDLAREVTVNRVDLRGASTTFLRASERIDLQGVLHLALVASDNVAARTLARSFSGGPEAFVARMNEKAVELGLTSTHFTDPSGLDARNVSSAYDLARLIAYAAEDELLSSIMRTSEYTLRTSRRTLTVHNTNQLVRSADIDVRGGKTGFISKSGHCLATLLRLPELNQTVAVVVLGARSNAGRFWETRHIFNWISAKAHNLFGGRPPLPPSAPDPVIHHFDR